MDLAILSGRTAVEFDYVNHRGERGRRRAILMALRFGSTSWHPEPQWLLEGIDLARGEARTYALKDIGAYAKTTLSPSEAGILRIGNYSPEMRP